MGIGEVWDRAGNVMTVQRVFGEPFEKNGTTVIPVAAVMGGGGGGGDEGSDDAGGAFGGGFGFTARPVGAYVIRGDRVEWHEATDKLRAVLGWQAVAIVGVFALRSMSKRRSKAKAKRRNP